MRLHSLALAGVALAGLGGAARAQWTLQQSGSTASLRGLSVVSGTTVWASGSRGTVLRTVNGGATWVSRAVPGADSRDIPDNEARDPPSAWVLSIGNGSASRIYTTRDGGATWELQFRNSDSAAFYDCITFWDARRGIAMSDPVDGRFRLLETTDGGATWKVLPAAQSPAARAGEGGFAASGTCLVSRRELDATGAERLLLWLTTGGSAARVLRSEDGGHSWAESITPLPSGAAPKGVFGISMLDATHGAAVGGDYSAPGDSTSTVAITSDGGATWSKPAGRGPGGYRSGVAYVPAGGTGRMLVAVGTSGTDVSLDGGQSWTGGDTLSLNAVAFAPGVSAGWAVGPRGTIAKWGGLAVNRRKD